MTKAQNDMLDGLLAIPNMDMGDAGFISALHMKRCMFPGYVLTIDQDCKLCELYHQLVTQI